MQSPPLQFICIKTRKITQITSFIAVKISSGAKNKKIKECRKFRRRWTQNSTNEEV